MPRTVVANNQCRHCRMPSDSLMDIRLPAVPLVRNVGAGRTTRLCRSCAWFVQNVQEETYTFLCQVEGCAREVIVGSNTTLDGTLTACPAEHWQECLPNTADRPAEWAPSWAESPVFIPEWAQHTEGQRGIVHYDGWVRHEADNTFSLWFCSYCPYPRTHPVHRPNNMFVHYSCPNSSCGYICSSELAHILPASPQITCANCGTFITPPVGIAAAGLTHESVRQALSHLEREAYALPPLVREEGPVSDDA